MAFLLADAAKLTQDQIVRGVIDQIITESAVLKRLPFLPVVGNALRYNREGVISSAAFYGVGDTWTEDTLQVDEISTQLTILGGDADVDLFLQQVYANPNDLRALAIMNKAKAVAYAFNDSFFHGNSGTNPNQFDGLDTISGAVANSLALYSPSVRAASNGANGATLTLATMDQFLDAIKPGKPDVIFCSKRSRRKLSALRRASGNLLETGVNEFGLRAMWYDGIPLEVDDNITDTETQGNTATNSSMYACQFTPLTGVMGLQNGAIQVDPIGELQDKNAWRTRLKWYVSMAVFRTLAVARLAGVQD